MVNDSIFGVVLYLPPIESPLGDIATNRGVYRWCPMGSRTHHSGTQSNHSGTQSNGSRRWPVWQPPHEEANTRINCRANRANVDVDGCNRSHCVRQFAERIMTKGRLMIEISKKHHAVQIVQVVVWSTRASVRNNSKCLAS